MKNISLVMKRVCAYMIDTVIVMLLALSISSIPFLRKNTEKYEDKYKEYEQNFNEYNDFYQSLVSKYEDNEINEEEYNELIKNDNYKDYIISYYEDNKITQGEFKKITNKINEEAKELTNEYNYKLGKIALSDTIITLVCTLLYFGVFQYFLKGQTIGKKILKLKVVSASSKKINILNYILRSLIVNNVLLNIVGVIFLAYSSKKIYIQTDSILGTIVSIIEAVIIFLVLTRDDMRGLHDLLFNTKVISLEQPKTEEIKEEKNNNKVIEATYEEPKDKTKKTKQSKNNKKKDSK